MPVRFERMKRDYFPVDKDAFQDVKTRWRVCSRYYRSFYIRLYSVGGGCCFLLAGQRHLLKRDIKR